MRCQKDRARSRGREAATGVDALAPPHAAPGAPAPLGLWNAREPHATAHRVINCFWPDRHGVIGTPASWGGTLDKPAFRTAARQIGCVTGMSDDRKWKLFVKWRGMSNAVIKEVEMLWFSHQSVERAIEDACYLPRHLTAIRLEGPNDECFDEKEILKLLPPEQNGT